MNLEEEIRQSKLIDYLDWGKISSHQNLSEEFIEEFADKVDWVYISSYQKLSEKFIEKFQDKVNWLSISRKQVLSEDFIREFADKVRWSNISYSQNLSESFIAEFETKVSWAAISDERQKDIIEPITNGAEKVASLRAVIGKYKADVEGKRRAFLIAQDVQAVLPEAVDATDPEQLGVAYSDVIPLLVSAIQEQQAIITELKTRIEALEQV
jgi:hypothetical protein